MNYIKYSRSFIILEDKESNFRQTSQTIKGHVKVEFKNNYGTLKCTIQNLKYYPNGDYFYKLYLFGKKDNETIFTNSGTLYIDKFGKCSHTYKFNALNIDGKNNSFYDYSLVAIIAQPNTDILDDEEIYPVLTGQIRTNHSEEEPAFNLDDHMNNNHVAAASFSPENLNEDTAMSELDSSSEPILAARSVHADLNNMKLSHEKFDISAYFNNYIRMVSSNLGNILPFYPEIKPFEKDRIGCKWWKVMNVMSIPFINTSQLQSYPEYLRPYSSYKENLRDLPASCHDLIYKYQHYIFGIESENNNITSYYYGIPGRYLPEEQPDRGDSGFKYWQPLQGSEKKKGDYGYWIISVRADTGELEHLEE